MGLKLPSRYLLLCVSLTLSFWILLNVMSFLYTGTDSNYSKRINGRHLQKDSPSDDFEMQLGDITEENDKSTIGLIRNTEDERIRDEGYAKHAFNELISNRLGFYREIQDKACKVSQKY